MSSKKKKKEKKKETHDLFAHTSPAHFVEDKDPYEAYLQRTDASEECILPHQLLKTKEK